MRFKSPGGNLTWLTPLFAFAGFFLAYHYYAERDWPGLVVFYGVFGLLSLLVWFDQKWVAIPLLILCALGCVGEISLLFMKGFSWHTAGKAILAGYAAYDFWEWRRRTADLTGEES